MKPRTNRVLALMASLIVAFSSSSQAQDETPPQVARHSLSPFITKDGANVTSTRISVYFNEPVDEGSALDAAHYSLAGSTITPIALRPGGLKVILDVSPAPAAESPYSLTVADVSDLAGNTLASVTLTGTTPRYEVNLAMSGVAAQSTTPVDTRGQEYGTADLANDGDIDGFFSNGSVTINSIPEDEGWWEVDLGASKTIGRLQVWFRTLTADECQALFNACGVRNDDFSLVILDEGRNEVFRRKYQGRPPGTVAYNLPPDTRGQFVRFEAQSPRTTSDGFFSLAEVAVIAPYENATIDITQSPASVSIVENQTAKLGPVAATVTGAPADRLQIQWEVDGIAIEGANSATYTTPAVPLLKSGSKYRAVFMLPGIAKATEQATVTVTADSVPPTIQSVVSSSAYIYLTVTFSEGVLQSTAEDIANYLLDGGLTVVEAIAVNPSTVRLTTTPQTPGQTYRLTVKGVKDQAARGGNTIAENSSKSFRVPESDQDKFVTIGNPNNPSDQDYSNGSGPQGSVGYVYQIGKYEVNNTEYAVFLNAKAKTDPNTLWDGGMQITREGEDGSYTYTVKEGWEKKPVYMVAAVDAMRYVNWVNNGATESSDTETGTYTFSGYGEVSARSSGADYFLPNENEWYKAAYYDPTKDGVGGYWLYPNRTSDPNLLNYVAPGDPVNQYSLCFLSPSGGPPGPCDEDAFPLSSSYYGTFNQAGNLWEWNELRPQDLLVPNSRPRRSGGSWGNNAARLAASVRADNDRGNGGASVNQGFRLARLYRPRPEFVTVGNPGNPADQDFSNGSGRQGNVNYEYQIGKYEVNNSDYAIFLNAKAKTDPNTLWDAGMQITREGEAGSYTYTVKEGWEKKPVYMVAAVDAMRFVNWLNNGGQESSDTESGSYQFTSYSEVGPREASARIVLPNENEWYKAAYFDPTKDGVGGYWLYPTRTSDPNLLNYVAPGDPVNQHSLCFLSPSGGPPGPCDEDAFPLSSSYYGTFSQAGNVWEWNELRPQDLLVANSRPRRSGGSWGNNAARLASSVRADNDRGNGGASVNQGFRLAMVPPLVRLSLTREGNFVKISWSGAGVLTSSSQVSGPYTPVDGVTGSPAQLPLNVGQARYFRIEQ